MININELKGRITAKGLTQGEVADKLGMRAETMSRKLKIGIFGTDEVEKMIDILDIENPVEIFFAKK